MSKRWRNTSTKECIGTIIFAIIAFMVILVPFAFDVFKFTFETLPFIGDELLATKGGESINVIFSLFLNPSDKSTQSIFDLVPTIYGYMSIAYFGILALDIVFALLLMTTKLKTFRIIFKIFSVIFAIFFIAFALVNLLYVFGVIFTPFRNFNIQTIGNDIIKVLSTSGILTALAFVIFSIMLVKKQLLWFSKPAWAKAKVEEEDLPKNVQPQ